MAELGVSLQDAVRSWAYRNKCWEIACYRRELVEDAKESSPVEFFTCECIETYDPGPTLARLVRDLRETVGGVALLLELAKFGPGAIVWPGFTVYDPRNLYEVWMPCDRFQQGPPDRVYFRAFNDTDLRETFKKATEVKVLRPGSTRASDIRFAEKLNRVQQVVNYPW